MPSPWLNDNYDAPEVFDIMLAATGDTAFDIGANGGFLSQIFADSFNKVIACEPCIESFDQLHSLWTVENLIPLNIAISDHDGEVELGVKRLTHQWGELFTGDSLAHWGPDYEKRTVTCKTLDSLSETFGFPTFLKVDVEGHEAKVLAGGRRTLENLSQYVIEVHGRSIGEECIDLLNQLQIPHRIIRHPAYRPEIGDWYNHYWLVSP